MRDLVALDGRLHRLVGLLVRELRRVDADDSEHVVVLRLERAQFVDDVQAVAAAARPEVEQNPAAAKAGERQRAGRVEPGTGDQLGRSDANVGHIS